MTRTSIIIPTLNRPELLARCLRSILQEFTEFLDTPEQSCSTLEIIVVDASDPSVKAENKTTLNHIFSKITGIEMLHITTDTRHQGIQKNMGLERATGDYVCFLDDDDFLVEGGLSSRLQHLQAHDCFAVFGNTLFADDSGTVFASNREYIREIMEKEGIGFHSLFKSNYIGSGAIMLRNHPDVRFDPEFRIGEDWLLWLKIIAKHKVCYIDKDIYCWTRGHDSLMERAAQKNMLKENTEKVRRKALEFQVRLQPIEALEVITNV